MVNFATNTENFRNLYNIAVSVDKRQVATIDYESIAFYPGSFCVHCRIMFIDHFITDNFAADFSFDSAQLMWTTFSYCLDYDVPSNLYAFQTGGVLGFWGFGFFKFHY